jgi:hypothetical protein
MSQLLMCNENENGPNSYQNLPRTLVRDMLVVLPLAPPSSMPIPPMATLTGLIGAESNTWGQGCDRAGAASRGLGSSRSYIEGLRGADESVLYCGSVKVSRAMCSRAKTCDGGVSDQ